MKKVVVTDWDLVPGYTVKINQYLTITYVLIF